VPSYPTWKLKEAKNLREEECILLFDAARKDSPRAHLMIALSYNACLRVSELVHIRVSDFMWEASKLSIIPLKKAGKRKVRARDGKIYTVERDLPNPVEYPMPQVIMDMAFDYIQDHQLKGDEYLFPGRANSCKIVKYNCPGGHITKRQVQYIFDRVAGAAGIKIKGRGIHSLKHARLTEVASKTKDPYLVKELGRHSSVTMSDIYVQYSNVQEKVNEIGGRT
jgi:integrase